MSDATLTLTDFLLARITEDEVTAQQAAEDGEAHWTLGEFSASAVIRTGSGMFDAEDHSEELRTARHIVRHDPARVLRECEAKRRQIAHLIRFMEGDYAPWNEDHLEIMAAVYADHLDYRPEWRP